MFTFGYCHYSLKSIKYCPVIAQDGRHDICESQSDIITLLDTQGLQSDWALFALGINLANSALLCTGKKVANHSP
jgi:hypothetical protein